MKYFLITADDKGQAKIEVVNPAALAQSINNGDYGDEPNFLDKLGSKDELQFAYNADTMVLIKGEIVSPTKAEVVTRYEIP